MKKKLLMLTLALAATAGLQAGLFSPAAQAASGCFPVDECGNVCCYTSTGKLVCTDRPCIDVE